MTITDSTVTGLSLAPAPNVTFSAIESLDVTTTGGGRHHHDNVERHERLVV